MLPRPCRDNVATGALAEAEDGAGLRLTDRLISWLSQLIPEFAKFAVVGSVAFVVADGGSNLLRFQVGLDPLTSNAIATIAGMVVAFVGNRYWTFRSRQHRGVSREGILFFVFNVAALLIQLACIAFTTYALGLTGKLPYNIALILGIGVGTLFRFWSYRKWIWRRSAPAPVGASQAKPGIEDHNDRGPGRRARSISVTPGSDVTGR